MIDRVRIVETARQWIGTPFNHQGRLKGTRVDCIGLPLMVAVELGLTGRDGLELAPDMCGVYPRHPVTRGSRLYADCQRILVEKELAELTPGDVLVLRPSHAGIVGEMSIWGLPGHFSLIHAYDSVGKVVEHLIDRHWLNRIAGCFTFPGVSTTWQ